MAEDSPRSRERPEFPAYRRLSGGGHYYRIESGTAFTEVQVVGSRRVVHHVRGTAYPERLRIMEMLACEGPYTEVAAAEWERVYAGIP